MCTAISFDSNGLYFGRTLDNDFSFGEKVTVTPRNFPLEFRKAGRLDSHFAIIGMAFVKDNYTLYYDAMNECGLCMAGLNFVGNAVYNEAVEDKQNIAQFELLPWILAKCRSVDEACSLLEKTNITNEAFSTNLPASQLHWLVADKNRTITVECTADGMKIYDNRLGVLTNNPPFDKQVENYKKYFYLSAKDPEDFDYKEGHYSKGVGTIGLPGDLTSQSRFVRAAFVKNNSVTGNNENESVNSFFHIMNSVEQQRGCCVFDEDKYEITIYTSCCSADNGIYYYTTYGNHRISAVDMNKENLDSERLVCYPLIKNERIEMQN
ncbi:MAG: choloylglycine hydrolase [Clostridia bacterium]|nr:choloylglycine hydrolase [Clostridia bacterium]